MERWLTVDFDNTLVKEKWPEIGEENPFAVETIKEFRKRGYKIILHTCREGKPLDDAFEWMKSKDIEPDYVNENPESNAKWGKCRKVYSHINIDDHNFGIRKLGDGSVDWLWIKRQLANMGEADDVQRPSHYQGKHGMQAIDVIEEFGLTECSHIANAQKYILRAGKKAGNSKVKDLSKAIFYLNRELENSMLDEH